jgi:hypothetical protein
VRKADGVHPGGLVRLVAKQVAGLLGRRAVIAEPISLHHEPEAGPEEIDAEAVHAPSGDRTR